MNLVIPDGLRSALAGASVPGVPATQQILRILYGHFGLPVPVRAVRNARPPVPDRRCDWCGYAWKSRSASMRCPKERCQSFRVAVI